MKKITPVKETRQEEFIAPKVTLMDAQPDILTAMHDDIAMAKKSIYLEIYRIAYDYTGEQFRDILAIKAKQGLIVKILVDSWGTPPNPLFFDPIVKNGGHVIFFRKMKFGIDFFTKNHRRNHRKILVIDDEICYIGSPNLTGYSVKWREICLRIEGQLAPILKKSIIDSIKLYDKYIFNKFSFKKTIFFDGFEIVQDLPSIYRQQIKKRYEKLIARARTEIIIETPYFLPGFKLRRLLAQAANRGVKVQIIMPLHSDVKIVDLLRDKYLKFFYKNGLDIQFFTASNLHAKCVMIDKNTFTVGSANFDYRSFRYQHEIILLGHQESIIDLVDRHLQESLKGCIPFDYERYLRRPKIERIFGWMLLPFRHFF
ncbi:MAG: phospholipase D-like domain-containing protein [Chloroflexota bacterium]|nr:phosphatidylserine/phosphatidylglycerophosphate/cardiolipin synthase family protein [Lentimicrobium sp.]